MNAADVVLKPEARKIITRICLQAYLRRMKREEEQQKASSTEK